MAGAIICPPLAGVSKGHPTFGANRTDEFSGKRMRELTVHHKDQNHDNNPPDGSNWELLCLYCHDDQHGVASQKAVGDRPMPVSGRDASPIANPFERLGELLGGKKEPSDP